MMRNILFVFLCLCVVLEAVEPDPQQSVKLKLRQPHWRLTITELHPEGTPKTVIYYEQLPE